MNQHFQKVMEQLAKAPKIGTRETPVVSFWPMRDKWAKYGDYWEQWGTDGDVHVDTKIVDGLRMADGPLMAPAELKLIYFRIPNSDLVCQLAYEHDPAELETGRTAFRRNNRIHENMRESWEAVKRSA